MIPITGSERKAYATAGYVLQAMGLFVVVTWIVAVMIGYVKKAQARGTWLESHFDWQIRTFWWGLLSVVIAQIVRLVGGNFGLGPLVLAGYAILLASAIWVIYRIVKGSLYLGKNRPVG